MKIIAVSSKEQYALVKTNNGSQYLTLLVKNALEALITEDTRMTESIFQLVRLFKSWLCSLQNFFLYSLTWGKSNCVLVFELCSRVKEWYVSVQFYPDGSRL